MLEAGGSCLWVYGRDNMLHVRTCMGFHSSSAGITRIGRLFFLSGLPDKIGFLNLTRFLFWTFQQPYLFTGVTSQLQEAHYLRKLKVGNVTVKNDTILSICIVCS